MKKQRNKLKFSDINKIKARYENKIMEFKEYSLEKLKEIYNTTKISRTDKTALMSVVEQKLEEQKASILSNIGETNNGDSNTEVTAEQEEV